MTSQLIAELGGNLFLQGLDIGVHKLDHLAGIEINEMIMMIPIRIFIPGAAIAKFVALQNARLFEEFHRSIDSRNRYAGIHRLRAGIELFYIRVIRAIFENLCDHPALAGHPEPFLLATRNNRVGHAPGLILRNWWFRVSCERAQGQTRGGSCATCGAHGGGVFALGIEGFHTRLHVKRIDLLLIKPERFGEAVEILRLGIRINAD